MSQRDPYSEATRRQPLEIALEETWSASSAHGHWQLGLLAPYWFPATRRLLAPPPSSCIAAQACFAAAQGNSGRSEVLLAVARHRRERGYSGSRAMPPEGNRRTGLASGAPKL